MTFYIKTWRYVLPLVIIPIIFVFTAAALKQARGPYWMGSNYDPDYAYLLNSLNLTQGHGIGHYDHPGTPVHILGALALGPSHLLRTHQFGGLAKDVLQYPEFYLNAISLTFLAINTILVVVIGLAAYQLTKNIWLSSLAQSSPFFSSIILNNSLVKVSAEPMLLTASLLLIWLSIMLLSHKQTPRYGYFSLGFAFIVSLGIATKITFAPLAIMPLFILPNLKRKIIYLLEAILAFIFFTLPIVPIYPAFLSWVYRLYSHAGIHGAGAAAIFDRQAFFSNIKLFEPAFRPFLVALGLIGGLILMAMLSPSRKEIFQKIDFKLIIGIMAAELVGIIMVGKHPGNHYFLPFIALAGFLIFLVVRWLQTLGDEFKFSKITMVALLIFLTLRSYHQTATSTKAIYQNLVTDAKELSALYDRSVNEFKDFAKIYYFRSSAEASALKFGDDYALGLYGQTLKKIYPDIFYYNIWAGDYHSWDDPTSLNEIIARYNHKVIFVGTSFAKHYQSEPQYKPNLPLVDILDGNPETIYRLAD